MKYGDGMVLSLSSPQQQIYDRVFSESLNLNYHTYDYLPASDAQLPFVFIGEQFNQDTANKSIVTGNVQQTIHIYGSKRQRKEVSTMMNSLKFVMRKIRKTDNFHISVRGLNSQMMVDNSTPSTLWHGIVEIEFKFN